MKRVFLIALTLVISVAFVTVVFAQAPAPEKKAPAPEKAMKTPDKSGVKEESGPQSSAEKKAEMKKAPKAPKGGQKEESTPTGESKKADKGPAPKAPKGGQKEESTPANK